MEISTYPSHPSHTGSSATGATVWDALLENCYTQELFQSKRCCIGLLEDFVVNGIRKNPPYFAT